MDKLSAKVILENPKLLNEFKEHSYYIKDLNRNKNYIKQFQNEMKIIYKERTSDKISKAIDSVEMVSDILDTLK